MTGIIEADDLTKTYNDTAAVSHIRFSVLKGEIFGFLGPNGAGKTTTMRMIQCVSPRTSGTLLVFGLDRIRTRQRSNNVLVLSRRRQTLTRILPAKGTCLPMPGTSISRKSRRRNGRRTFLRLYRSPRNEKPVSTSLSGGMKRRLILARALINTPDLLILDEPTIGLDPQARHLIWERLRLLRAQGNTIVLTTHYLDEAARLRPAGYHGSWHVSC